MNTYIVIGGSGGIGLSIALNLSQNSNVLVIDKNPFPTQYQRSSISFEQHDLTDHDLGWLNALPQTDGLFITAGFGHLMLAQDTSDDYLTDIFSVNAVAPVRIIRHFLPQMLERDMVCAVMVSIAGRLVSPMFSAYSATKAALSKYIEAVNIELEMQGCKNRILEVSPGSIKGTSFNGQPSDPQMTASLAQDIISAAEQKKTLLIPDYENTFRAVLQRYHTDPHTFGKESYEYKMKRLKQ